MLSVLQLATEKPQIILHFKDVPVQSGTYDCGLYAIAFVTALAIGEKPELFFFDQTKMRRHLFQCFERRAMQMFPVTKRMKKCSVKAIEEVNVYCKCTMPELPGEHMIQCTTCEDWYHIGTCTRVPSRQINNHLPWFCPKCQ